MSNTTLRKILIGMFGLLILLLIVGAILLVRDGQETVVEATGDAVANASTTVPAT